MAEIGWDGRDPDRDRHVSPGYLEDRPGQTHDPGGAAGSEAGKERRAQPDDPRQGDAERLAFGGRSAFDRYHRIRRSGPNGDILLSVCGPGGPGAGLHRHPLVAGPEILRM